MMVIFLEPEAKAYIEKNGGKAMVILGNMRGCCGGVSPLPKIELGPPKDLSAYAENKIGRTLIFVDKNLKEVERMRITFAKLLWLNKLSVEIEQ